MLGTFILLAAAMWITPSDGIEIGPVTYQMPGFDEIFSTGETEYADVSEIIDSQFNIDSLVTVAHDSLHNDSIRETIHKASYDSLVSRIHKLELTDSARTNLYRFFEKLENDNLTRVMHYGDSQIEGDRMTEFIREKLQGKFGGTGLGLLAAIQTYDFAISVKQEYSSNWERFTLSEEAGEEMEHNRYGAMAAFSRFAPQVNDSLPFTDSVYHEANLGFEGTSVSFKRTRVYEHFRLFYGNNKRPVEMQLTAGDTLVLTDTLQPNIDYAVIEADLPDTTSHISLHFEGWDSPDIYGIELAARRGVIVDNIAMRGSSGLFFNKKNLEHSRKMFNDLNPGLFILQFGGNVIPYMDEQSAIDNYGRMFRYQINRLQQVCPDAAFVVIGPSDMSTKEKDRYVTYDHLPDVVEVLKEAAHATGCGYWDMFEAMGGKNSMPSWVNAEPELARPDYVHLSVRGSRLISNMFYNAFIHEYNNYLRGQSNKEQPTE